MSGPELNETSCPTRREFVALGIGAFVVAGLPGVVRPRSGLVRRTVPVMGTVAELAVLHRDPRYAHAAIDAAIAQLRFVDRTMTRFDPGSEVGRVNLEALRAPVAVSAHTATVLGEALSWAVASGGGFDPCLGKAIVLWDVGRRTAPPPGRAVRQLANRDLYRALELDADKGGARVRLHDADAAIDLGGIAKGYGVDRAAAALRDYGIYNALINVGGDLYALGRSEDGDPWRVGIRDPQNPSGIIETIEVSDQAVATSGDYLQFFNYDGRRYHHMLDPETGAPKQTAARSVTVVASTCMDADAAGTTAFGMAPDRARAVLERRAPGARIVHSV